MLNSYNFRTGPSSVYQKIDIKEHRAPTDESVRLLKEMEEKALQKILGSVTLHNNPIQFHMTSSEDYLKFAVNVYVRMKINGTVIEHRFEIDKMLNEEGRIEKIIKEVSQMVALHLLNGVDYRIANDLLGVKRVP